MNARIENTVYYFYGVSLINKSTKCTKTKVWWLTEAMTKLRQKLCIMLVIKECCQDCKVCNTAMETKTQKNVYTF